MPETETTVRTPVLVRDGRRFVDEKTIMQLISDVDPIMAITLNRYILQWKWEKVVPVEGLLTKMPMIPIAHTVAADSIVELGTNTRIVRTETVL